MCVIERKTYLHLDGRRETTEYRQLCRNATGRELCPYVEERSIDAVRIVERRPDSSSSSPLRFRPDDLKVTTGKDGAQRRYKPITRRPSTGDSAGRASRTGDRSSVDSFASISSPLAPTFREIRPPAAPTAPSAVPSLSSPRRPTAPSLPLPPDPNRTVGPGGTAIYVRPPSLEMARAENNERPSSIRRVSVTVNNPREDDTRPRPTPLQRPSGKRVTITTDSSSSSSHTTSSASAASSHNGGAPTTIPSLSVTQHSRQDSATVLPSSIPHRHSPATKPSPRHERSSSSATTETDRLRRARRQEEDRETDARRATSSSSESHHRAREANVHAYITRDRREAENAAAAAARESSREAREGSRESNIRAARAALEGDGLAAAAARERSDSQTRARRVRAEVVAMERERRAADESAYAHAQTRLSLDPPSARASPRNTLTTTTYRFPDPSPASPTSSRGSRSGGPWSARVVVHNPSAPPAQPPTTTTASAGRERRRESSLLERGEAVLARERARGAVEEAEMGEAAMRLDALEFGELEGEAEEEGRGEVVAAGLGRRESTFARSRRAGRGERERARDAERRERMGREGYHF